MLWFAPQLQGCIGCDNSLPRRPGQQPVETSAVRSLPQRPESTGKTVVRMTKDGGIYKVPVRINGIEMDFIFDTGASLISISNVEASFLVKQGKIKLEDIEGSSQFVDALGNVSEGTIINLREVSIGDRTAYNVKASVVDNNQAPLLLGQTFLEQFGRISIDYTEGTLTFY